MVQPNTLLPNARGATNSSDLPMRRLFIMIMLMILEFAGLSQGGTIKIKECWGEIGAVWLR